MIPGLMVPPRPSAPGRGTLRGRSCGLEPRGIPREVSVGPGPPKPRSGWVSGPASCCAIRRLQPLEAERDGGRWRQLTVIDGAGGLPGGASASGDTAPMAWSTLIKTSGYIALEVTVDMRIVSLDHRPLPGSSGRRTPCTARPGARRRPGPLRHRPRPPTTIRRVAAFMLPGVLWNEPSGPGRFPPLGASMLPSPTAPRRWRHRAADGRRAHERPDGRGPLNTQRKP